MLLLAFDTSSVQGSVAIVRDGVELASREWQREKSHSELLTGTIEEVMSEGGLSLRDLDGFAVGLGPGSFTGIRVAVTSAKALAYALGKPVFGFDDCVILAESAPSTSESLLVLITAHRNLVYTATFGPADAGSRERLSPTVAIEAGEAESMIAGPASWLCVGSGWSARQADLPPALISLVRRDPLARDFPQAVAIARLAEIQKNGASTFDWNAAQPLYIRASEPEEKRRN